LKISWRKKENEWAHVRENWKDKNTNETDQKRKTRHFRHMIRSEGLLNLLLLGKNRRQKIEEGNEYFRWATSKNG